MNRPLGLVLAGVLVGASCALVPDTEVRVAVAPDDAEARALWASIAAALPEAAPPVTLVAPGSWPPADLVWTDGALGDEALAHALLAPSAVAEAGLRAGLAPGWFAIEGDRVLPLWWRPWAWWQAEAAASGEVEASVAWALATDEARIGTGGPGAGVPERAGRVWAPADRAAQRRLNLAAVEPRVPTRVRGLWWDDRGWNRRATEALVSALWSAEVRLAVEVPAPWLWATDGPEGLRAARSIRVFADPTDS